MTPVLSTTAWVLHDLGLATGFGGALFGKTALNPAVKHASDEEERGEILEAAWKDYSWFNAASLGIVGLTWLVGRTMNSGREVDSTSRGLVLAKDVLVATAVASGLGAMASGHAISLVNDGQAPPVRVGSEPSPDASPAASALVRTSSVLGYVNLAALAGIIGVTAVLAMRSGRSARWSLFSRRLP